jgi:hypothetical protein
MLAEGLVNLLLLDSPTVAILGTPAQRQALDSQGRSTTGVFAAQMPEGAVLPAVVFTDIHSDDMMTMDGPDPFTMARMQFSCYGASYADSKRLARAVRQLFENFTGTLADLSQIDSMRRIGEMDAFEDAPFSYAAHVDFEIAYRIDPGAPYTPPTPIPGLASNPYIFTADGTTSLFTLPIVPPRRVMVWWNDLLANVPTDYSITGAQITLARLPMPNDNITVLLL